MKWGLRPGKRPLKTKQDVEFNVAAAKKRSAVRVRLLSEMMKKEHENQDTIENPPSFNAEGLVFKTALEFGLWLMNNEKVSTQDRIRVALAIAPYQHGKYADLQPAKPPPPPIPPPAVGSSSPPLTIEHGPIEEKTPVAAQGWGDDLAFGKK